MSKQENKNRGQYEKFCVEMVNEDGRSFFGEFADEDEAADFAKGFLVPHFPDAEYLVHPLAMALRLADSGKHYVIDEDLFTRREKTNGQRN